MQAARDIIEERRDQRKDVGAVIVEPITSNVYRIASPYYFRKLREICEENQIPFIVNETQTGVGITGKMWAHEHWFLNTPPDLVTFANRSVAAGFYASDDFKQNLAGITTDDEEVDLTDLIKFSTIQKQIIKKNLLQNASDMGDFTKIELARIQREK